MAEVCVSCPYGSCFIKPPDEEGCQWRGQRWYRVPKSVIKTLERLREIKEAALLTMMDIVRRHKVVKETSKISRRSSGGRAQGS